VILGVAIGLLLGRRIDSINRPPKPSVLAWTAFAFGVAAVIMLASALFLPLALPGPAGSVMNSAQISIVLSMAAVTDAVWAIVRRDRRWVSWTALVVGALPTLFWALFALGYLLDPNA
jgi:hypothetical protein